MKFRLNPKPRICIDGTTVQLQAEDLDHDGITGGVEKVVPKAKRPFDFLKTKSELGEVTENMNKDEIEPEIDMSTMDKMSRLHPVQIPAIAVWDYLVKSNFLMNDALHVSRQIKRLEVSRDGQGRAEWVEVVGRKTETEAKKGLGNMMRKTFGGKDETQ